MLRNYARSRGYSSARGMVIPDFASHYWEARRCCPLEPDQQQWMRVIELSQRYALWCHYHQEVVPAWQELGRVHYADNSVEVVEVATAGPLEGQTRQRTVLGAGGDACY